MCVWAPHDAISRENDKPSQKSVVPHAPFPCLQTTMCVLPTASLPARAVFGAVRVTFTRRTALAPAVAVRSFAMAEAAQSRITGKTDVCVCIRGLFRCCISLRGESRVQMYVCYYCRLRQLYLCFSL